MKTLINELKKFKTGNELILKFVIYFIFFSYCFNIINQLIIESFGKIFPNANFSLGLNFYHIFLLVFVIIFYIKINQDSKKNYFKNSVFSTFKFMLFNVVFSFPTHFFVGSAVLPRRYEDLESFVTQEIEGNYRISLPTNFLINIKIKNS
jgi:hypothetical protein